MSIEKLVFIRASWLGLFKLISQIFSWVITILVARILVPGDYGLMGMATILTGYALMFSELGLGAAIIQKPGVTSKDKELSSVFWFTSGVGIFFALLCFALAYPTAYIFSEDRVIPITQMVSLLFIINSLVIVPFNLLKKELEFKKVGFIEMICVFISCCSMLLIARMGGGVWTLIGGHIIREFSKMIMTYYYAKWIPQLHFKFYEARSYLKYGVTVAAGRSLYYVYTRSGSFFAGRAWNANTLGYYSFAVQLANLPTEKIVTLINQVSFSVFSKLQEDKVRFNEFYLNIVKTTAIIVVPVFVGGYLIGEELIILLLGEKWMPMIFVFKCLCLSQIFEAINAVNNFVHNSLGNPHRSLVFHAICIIFIPVSFYFAVQHGFNAIVIPWLSIYVLLYTFWIIFSLKKIGINLSAYGKNLMPPILSVLSMAIAIEAFDYLILDTQLFFSGENILLKLVMDIVLGISIYLSLMYLLEKQFILNVKKLWPEKEIY